MLFKYKVIGKDGLEYIGEIEAHTEDTSINSLQHNGLVVISVLPVKSKNFFNTELDIFNHISTKELSIISRQIATLLEANVPALKTFHLIASESENPIILKKFTEIADDIQNGVSISGAFYKHPSIFNDFYVNMVRGGEESGKLSEIFLTLADYLEHSSDLISKVRGALIYPIFVIISFIIVMILLLTLVIPELTDIIIQGGQPIPFYTKIVIGVSALLIDYGVLIAMLIIAILFFGWKYTRGTNFIAHTKLWFPIIGNLYRTLYLSRITDTMSVMLSNGIPMVRSLEITARVVNNSIYRDIIEQAIILIKAGGALSTTIENHKEIPRLLIQMIKVGEETGELSTILKKLSIFYQREVSLTITTIISLIEPAMIIVLGISVGGILASVLLPIYQIAGSL